jgi:hypothetical protein
MSNGPSQYLSEIFSIRFGDMIASVGEGVATAQAAMDRASLEATLAVYSESGDPGLMLLREIGYQPNFYVIPKASGKLMVSLSMFSESTPGGGSRLSLMASPLNPTLANKYGYSGSASAEMSFDIMPVPPNEQIRRTPDVTGKTAALAAATLLDLGLAPAFVDAAGLSVATPAERAVTLQSPAAGTIVKIDTNITLTV